MQNVIIGTAGHIDHGKTTLIKALTGRSTDTLNEEIKRGISINLGFTYFDLPSGKRAGIIDVPGHEKFIKNMLAGAAGIDIVLLTIAANEGVKPQTIEHVDILSYLDIQEKLIVLTKSDLADEVLMELAKDDIREKLADTIFQKAEMIEVDSVSKKGLDILVEKINTLANRIEGKNENTSARLNIDRVFSLRGFGTIVTGTLSEGKIRVGDELMVYPKGLKAKIRNVQVHEQNIDVASAGQRTALNIANLKKEELSRGDVLAKAGSMESTKLLDVKIGLVPHTERKIAMWDRVRVYLGTKEILARVVPLDVNGFGGGENAFCQLRLEEEAVARKNDKFVIRYYSPMETIGGGVILDPRPKKHGRADKLVLEALKTKESGGIVDVVDDFIRDNGENSTGIKQISDYISKDAGFVRDILSNLIEDSIIIEINGSYFHVDVIEKFKVKTLTLLSKYHEVFCLRKGMPKEELKSKLKTGFKPREFDFLLEWMAEETLVKTIGGNHVALYHFEVIYNEGQKNIRMEIEQLLLEKGYAPPNIEEITKKDKQYQEVLESLIPDTLLMLDSQTVMHKQYYNKAKDALIHFIEENGEITLPVFRDMIGSSRKYAMLLLDDFDKNRITRRVGDKRIR